VIKEIDKMPTYSLFFNDGISADDDNYTDLAEARDVAFLLSQEDGSEVNIYQMNGECEVLVETVLA
jgi:hypothetical protein